MAESNASKLANNILTDGKFDATDVVGNITSTGIDDNATSTAITITSGQSVGIGTSAPNDKLHIAGNVFLENTSPEITFETGPSHYNWQIAAQENVANALEISVGSVDADASNDTFSPVAVFKNTGEVGIGETAPSQALDVVGSIEVSDGIYIGGTASANKLDDYEEGTWTPVFAGGSTSGTYTYLEQQGHYVKVGNLVTAWFNLTNITTSSAGTGTIQILGLPFSANWQSGFNGGGANGSMEIHDFNNISGVHTFVNLGDASSQFSINKQSGANNGSSGVDVGDKNSDSADIRGFVTYYTGG